MIAEDDCKTELERLLNEHKLSFNNELYKFVEKQKEEYSIFINKKSENINYEFIAAVHDFLENYAKKYCKIATYKKYSQQFKYDITPYFEKLKINDITVGNIKNKLALLKQFIKYFQEQGLIDTKCVFQVRRLTKKNEFNENRLIFKEIYE